MGLFNRQIKKKTTNGNGSSNGGTPSNGHDTNGHGTNGHDEEEIKANGDAGTELFEVKTDQTMPERIAHVAKERSPASIKALIPWLEKARSSPEGRASFIDRTKEVAW